MKNFLIALLLTSYFSVEANSKVVNRSLIDVQLVLDETNAKGDLESFKVRYGSESRAQVRPPIISYSIITSLCMIEALVTNSKKVKVKEIVCKEESGESLEPEVGQNQEQEQQQVQPPVVSPKPATQVITLPKLKPRVLNLNREQLNN